MSSSMLVLDSRGIGGLLLCDVVALVDGMDGLLTQGLDRCPLDFRYGIEVLFAEVHTGEPDI